MAQSIRRVAGAAAFALAAVGAVAAQQSSRQGGAAERPAPRFATPTPKAPLFFREGWRQPGGFDASTEFDPSFPITPAAVTNPNLELKLYDPNARRIAEYAKTPPPGSIPRDWVGNPA